MNTNIDAVAALRKALKNLINLDQRSGWHSKEQDAAIAALDATERAAIQPAGEAVLFFKQKCSKIWIETDRINWLDDDPKLADLFDVRTLYAAPISEAPAIVGSIGEDAEFCALLDRYRRHVDGSRAALVTFLDARAKKMEMGCLVLKGPCDE